MHNLILIGLPASGKTTVGQALAQRLAMPFYDCDAAVEAALGQSIASIFSQYGEAFFRDEESRMLSELCRKEGCVIATGGGAVLRAENRALLRRSGVVFWLDRPLCDIMSTNFQQGRPLLAEGAEALARLAAQRQALYAVCACHRIREPLLDKVVEEIITIWRGEAI